MQDKAIMQFPPFTDRVSVNMLFPFLVQIFGINYLKILKISNSFNLFKKTSQITVNPSILYIIIIMVLFYLFIRYYAVLKEIILYTIYILSIWYLALIGLNKTVHERRKENTFLRLHIFFHRLLSLTQNVFFPAVTEYYLLPSLSYKIAHARNLFWIFLNQTKFGL